MISSSSRDSRPRCSRSRAILKGREDTEFYAAPELSPELKWTRVGDTVAIDFDEGKLRSVLINTFDNPRLALVMAP
jgi:hypothetical protein